jgi:AAA ATPase domain/Effector-associated domain 1
MSPASRFAGLTELAESRMVERLATRASFDPDALDNATALQPLCEELHGTGGRREWMLRESIRVEALAKALNRGGRGELQTLRADAGAVAAEESPLQMVLDSAIADTVPPVTLLSEDELVAALHVGRWFTKAAAHAGRSDLIPKGLDRDPIEARLSQLEMIRPIRELTADGCIGRDKERAALRAFVEHTADDQSLVDLPALQIYGIGGVGKSTLLAQFVLDLAESSSSQGYAWAYVDLDRPTLSSYHPQIVLADVIRQVGTQFPDARRYLEGTTRDLSLATRGQGVESRHSEAWRYSLHELARAVTDVASGRLVVILDTFEELQREGEDSESLLFDMFRTLSEQLEQFRLIISGRAPVTTFLDTAASPQLLPIRELEGDDADALLQHVYRLEVSRRSAAAGTPSTYPPLDRGLSESVIETVGGSPLTLKLAAQVLATEGPRGITDAANRLRALDLVRTGFIEGFLYHRILDHLGGRSREQTSLLRTIARACLALRAITPDVLTSVVFAVIGRPDLDSEQWYRRLRSETGLAYAGSDSIWVRDELRDPALLALSFENPDLIRRMHEAAVVYYEQRRDEPDAERELAYHLLALGQPPEDLPTHGLELTETALESSWAADLPADARISLRAWQAPDVLAEALEQRTQERKIEAAAERALANDELDEAEMLLADHASWSAGTTLYRLDAQLQERRGHLRAASEAASCDVRAAATADHPERYAAAVVRHALLEERCEQGELGAAVLAEATGAPVLVGHTTLRLQLHLNRMAMLERIGAAVDWWRLSLDARALLWRLGSAAAMDSALTRLLAATLGREETHWVRTAVRELGFGLDPNSRHLEVLADALGEWDADPPAGEAAGGAGLLPTSNAPSVKELKRIWFQGIAGTGTIGGSLLERAWSIREPSRPVIEAVRTIYLWWGLDANRQFDEPHSSDHFLDGVLDFSDSDLQQFSRALVRSYPRTEDVEVIASDTGLDVNQLNLRQSASLLVREVLRVASSTGLLPNLVSNVLNDPRSKYIHGLVKDIVGPTWLEEHNITS